MSAITMNNIVDPIENRLECDCQKIFSNINDFNIEKIRTVRDKCKKTIKECLKNEINQINDLGCTNVSPHTIDSLTNILIPDFMRPY
jgi:uncharacterized membrane protein YgaE (UPF0421/DUF939 family)